MAKNRTRRSSRDYDLVDKLKHENQKLKKEISSLRKQLARVDFDRYSNLQQLVDKQRKEAELTEDSKKLEQLKKKWECWGCGKDHLKIIIWDHPVKGVMYYRKCFTCDHRTEMKPYNDKIEGIKVSEGEE